MKLKQKILMIGIIPILVLGASILWISNSRVESVVTEVIENGLRSSVVAVQDSLAELNDDAYTINENDELY